MIILVGQALAVNQGGFALNAESRVGQKLSRLADEHIDDWAAERHNLIDGYHDPKTHFPYRKARLRAAALYAGWETISPVTRSRKIILLGRVVAECFFLQDLKWLTITEFKHNKIVVFPHPSGLSRWWNNPANTQAAEKLLRQLIKEDRG